MADLLGVEDPFALGRRLSRRTFAYRSAWLELRERAYPSTANLMLGKLAAILKGVNGVENAGLAELIGFEPPPLPPEEQEKLDKGFFGALEARARKAPKKRT
jgi:hypothetical protein